MRLETVGPEFYGYRSQTCRIGMWYSFVPCSLQNRSEPGGESWLDRCSTAGFRSTGVHCRAVLTPLVPPTTLFRSLHKSRIFPARSPPRMNPIISLPSRKEKYEGKYTQKRQRSYQIETSSICCIGTRGNTRCEGNTKYLQSNFKEHCIG